MLRTISAAFIAFLFVAACGGTAASAPSSPSTAPAAVDPDGQWQLVSGTVDGQQLALNDDARVTLVVEGSSVSGDSACNRYFGEFTMIDGRVTLGGLGATEMACADPVMAIEAAYLAGLSKVDSALLDGAVLVLGGPDTKLRFERLPPPPAAVVIGTQWVLEGLIDGDAISSTVGDPATLVLHADGTLEGSTGCRTLTGTYSVEGDEFNVTQLDTEGECPADVATQDAHVLEVLGDGFRVSMTGELLTLNAAGGAGLSYGATTP
jgi:heat shock protein HslJ